MFSFRDTKTYIHHVALLIIIIFISYSNTFSNSWQLDDTQNILQNPAIHIENIQPKTLLKTFYADPSFNDKLYRPISCLTFALNWFIGKKNTFGYHIVNLIVHIIAAIYLYKISLLLLQSPRCKHRTEKEILAISILGATLWALNPIQTQAVTYIVQRMASMEAMFFIIALWQYSYARLVARTTWQRLLHIILCGLFFLIAMGCKENAVTLIPTILLTELLLFERTDRFSKNLLLLILIGNFVFLSAFCYLIIKEGYFNSITLPYASRPFSILERLLTQPSVLFFYLSLIFFPNPTRLSIDHSFPVSTSMWTPWTTFPAILGILLITAIAIVYRKKHPLISYAVLFFFINHLIESSFIPLEMVFEHRNYLPSMFLFIVLSTGIWNVILYTEKNHKLAYFILLITIPVSITAYGLGTYSRNMVWKTEETLWADALKKAPNNARPMAQLGIIYGWEKENTPDNIRKSAALLLKSIELEFPNTKFKAAFIDNIGKMYARQGLYQEAIKYFNNALQLNDNYLIARIDLTNCLLESGKFDEALKEIDIILSEKNIHKRFYLLKSTILLWSEEYQQATDYSRKYILESESDKENGYYLLGIALTKNKFYDRGRFFLKLAHQHQPHNIQIILSIIENCIISEDDKDADAFIQKLITSNDLESIYNILKISTDNYSLPPINMHLITPYIQRYINNTLFLSTQNQNGK